MAFTVIQLIPLQWGEISEEAAKLIRVTREGPFFWASQKLSLETGLVISDMAIQEHAEG
jgi:hypothetical protein